MQNNIHTPITLMPEQPSKQCLQAIKGTMYDTNTLVQFGLNGLCIRIYESLRKALQVDDSSVVFVCKTEDVQYLRPDLDEEEAKMVLRHIKNDINLKLGRFVNALKEYADELYP